VSAQYYYLDPKEGQIGPQSYAELIELRSAGIIGDHTLIRDGSTPKWVALSTIMSADSPEPASSLKAETSVIAESPESEPLVIEERGEAEYALAADAVFDFFVKHWATESPVRKIRLIDPEQKLIKYIISGDKGAIPVTYQWKVEAIDSHSSRVVLIASVLDGPERIEQGNKLKHLVSNQLQVVLHGKLMKQQADTNDSSTINYYYLSCAGFRGHQLRVFFRNGGTAWPIHAGGSAGSLRSKQSDS
jgi:hypothetical protein